MARQTKTSMLRSDPAGLPFISNRDEPQNIEQGMSNDEVNGAHALPSTFCGSLLDILRFNPALISGPVDPYLLELGVDPVGLSPSDLVSS